MIFLEDTLNSVKLAVNPADISSIQIQQYGSSGGVNWSTVIFSFVSKNDQITIVLSDSELQKLSD